VITTEEALKKPLPSPDADTAALWAGMRDGKLLLQHCRQCGNVEYYQQQMCRKCGSEELEHKAASGQGKVHSFSVVHRAPGPAFKDEVPYAVLLVELAEGPRMISTYTGGPPDDVTFDMDVQVVFEIVSDEIALPRFRQG
jgi:uncharacterized OB-fold protein